MNPGNMQNMIGSRGDVPATQQQYGGIQRNVTAQQIRKAIYQALQHEEEPVGWQREVPVDARTMMVLQFVTSCRLLKPETSLPGIVDLAKKFERKIYGGSMDKNDYQAQCRAKLEEITLTRTKQAADFQQRMRDSNGPQLQMFPQQMPGQSGIPVQMQGQLQQGFPNMPMQQPLQPSPMPVQQMMMQQTQPGLMNSSMMNNQLPVQQTPQTIQNTPRQGLQGTPLVLTPQENQRIQEIARKIAHNTKPPEMEIIRQRTQNVSAEQRETWRHQGLDPLAWYFRQQAVKQIMTERGMRGIPVSQQSHGPAPSGNGFNPQQPQPVSRNPSNTQGQSFAAVTATPNFEPPLPGSIRQNMNQIRNVQQEALRSQEQGQIVVPASSQRSVPQQQQGQTPRGMMQVAPQQQPGHPPSQARATPNPTNAQQQHLQAQQQQKEKIQQVARMQPQIQNAMAAQGQLPQQATLQGQIGGLTNQISQGPPQQSPAMPNLNRPLATTMQHNQAHGPSQVQGTLQGRPKQRVPPNQAQNIEALSGQQSMPRQQQQPVVNPQNQAALNQILSRMAASLPDHMKQRLQTIPEAERRNVLLGLHHRAQQRIQQQQMQNLPASMAPNGTPIPGHNLPAGLRQQPNAQQPDQGTLRQPQGLQVPPQAGKNNQQQASMGTPHPYGGQSQGQMQHTMPNQQPVQNRPVSMNNGFLTPGQVRYMDQQDFPPNMLSSTAFVQQVPKEVKMWGQLKSWVAQNPHIMPANISDKLKSLQFLHFQSLASIHSKQQQMLNLQSVQSANPLPQHGPAPPAQMVQMSNQQRPMMGQNLLQMARAGRMPPVQPPSLQDLQAARSRLPENGKGMTDEQLGQLLMHRQYQQMMQLAQNQQNHNTSQMQYEHIQQAQRHQAQRQLLQTQVNQSTQAQNHQQNSQQPSASPQNLKKAGGQANVKGPVQVTTRPGPHAPNQSPAPPKGSKRSNTDDVVEVPNPNQIQMQDQRMPNHGKAGYPKQNLNLPQNSQDQAVPASQPARQYEAELRKQAVQGNSSFMQPNLQHMKPGVMPMNTGRPGGEDEKKYRLAQIVNEVMRAPYTRKPVPMDRQTRERMVNQLRENQKLISRVEESLRILFLLFGDEAMARELVGIRLLLIKQYRDKEFNPVDQFTITPEELDSSIATLKKAFNYVIQKLTEQRRLQMSKNGIANNNVAQYTAAPTAQISTPPLNAANLQQNQQAELQVLQAQRQTSMQRTNSSRENRTPAAPTSSQHPLSFGAQSPSPHGVPQYNSPNGLTQEMLTIRRTTKKRKTNDASSTVTTPVQTQGTPGSIGSSQTKIPSPQMGRSGVSSSGIKCPIVDCASAKQDFATVEDLAKHTAEVHEVKDPVIEDPLSYALESIRIGLGLDENGKAKPRVDGQRGGKGENDAPEMKLSSSMQGQTPSRQEGDTPMSRIPTQSGGSDPSDLLKSSNQNIGSSKETSSKSTREDVTKLTSTSKDVLTVPKNPWDGVAISPRELSECFPSLAELNDDLTKVKLTPPSTLSSGKSEKSSPKPSDIDEDDLLHIRIEGEDSEFWINPDLYEGSIFGERNPPFVNDEILDMSWETTFGVPALDGLEEEQSQAREEKGKKVAEKKNQKKRKVRRENESPLTAQLNDLLMDEYGSESE